MNSPDYLFGANMSPFEFNPRTHFVHDLTVGRPAGNLLEVHAEVLLQGLTLLPGTLC